MDKKEGSLCKSILENAPEFIVTIDATEKILYANKTVKKFSPSRTIGEEWSFLISPRSRETLSTAVKHVFKNGKPKFVTFQAGDLQTLYSANLFASSSGVTCIARDITSQEKLRVATKERELLFRELFEQGPLSLALLGLNLRFIEMNKRFQNMIGYSVDELKNSTLMDITHTEDVANDLRMVRDIIQGNSTSFDSERRFVRKDEGVVWGRLNLTPVRDGSGKIFNFLAAVADITEKKHTKQRLRTSNEQLNKIVNSTSEIVISVDYKGNILLWNKAMQVKTGVPMRNIIENNILDHSFPEHIQPLIEIIKRALLSGTPNSTATQMDDGNGNNLDLFVNVSLIGSEEAFEGVVLIAHDVTDHKNMIPDLTTTGYISFKEDLMLVFQSFSALQYQGYALLCVARNDEVESFLPKETIFLYLSTTNTLTHPESLLLEIKKKIESKGPCAILLTRLDYLCTQHGFATLMKFLYELQDVVQAKNHLLLVQVNPHCFDERQLALLKREFAELSFVQKKPLKDDHIRVLQLVAQKNLLRQAVNMSTLASHLKVSRLTARTWVRQLQSQQLLRLDRSGNVKYVLLTEEGQKLVDQASQNI